jgi:hypothetical protein
MVKTSGTRASSGIAAISPEDRQRYWQESIDKSEKIKFDELAPLDQRLFLEWVEAKAQAWRVQHARR